MGFGLVAEGKGWGDMGWEVGVGGGRGGEKVYMKDSSQMSLIYYCIVKEML